MKSAKLIPSFFIVGVKDFAFSRELETFLKTFPVSGLALFNSPFDNPLNIWNDREAAMELIYDFVVKTLPQTGFLSCDQEGGRVRRLRAPFVHLPPAQEIRRAFDETRDANTITKLFQLSARQMASTGIRLNFAPVCDLITPESNKVVGDRSFGKNAEEVLPLVSLFCSAFEGEGVHTTLKHFPGHGPTKLDSHEQVAVVSKSKEELWNEDREIFVRAAKSTSAIMTAHIAFESEPHRILSLDKDLLTEFKAGFSTDLAWITDDLLSMKAVSEKKPWMSAFDCAYDFILTCGDLDQAAVAIEETIRHAETSTKSFTEELAVEKRVKRSTSFFRTQTNLARFSDWKQNILDLEEQGQECLEKLKIKV